VNAARLFPSLLSSGVRRRAGSCVGKGRGSRRGLTLIELLITIALIAIVTTGILFGTGAIVRTRVRSATSMMAGAVRTAFTRASATSRPNRIVFDLDGSKVWLEESNDPVLVKKDDAAGGAEAATPEERDAIEQARRILKGPQVPRPRFSPVKSLGFDEDGGGRPLGKGVRFFKVETGHTTEGQTAGRAYLYFWPGGQTERASIQITIEGSANLDDVMTLIVSPLTGRVRILRGSKSMDPLRDDGTSSEREEQLF
jgi:general secretion pathway protein H